ncbi:hypothetical protein DH2020_042054 [Rehmannia glutinosa]|uniref:Uncharacterized protein n=1 Tax=Rehmannia glutinosa TaxID=99300 RepID=A0ABR0UPM5_REHGL
MMPVRLLPSLEANLSIGTTIDFALPCAHMKCGSNIRPVRRYSAPENINGYKEELCSEKECTVLANGASVDNQGRLGLSIEDAAANQIQTAYRAYSARKTFRRMRGMAEWTSGSETIDVALARIHQREEAAVRRERAMAYAFSHQWRANSNPSFGSGNHELSKSNWGWSWMDRWIAARPWESRVAMKESPKKAHKPNKILRNKISPTCKTPDKVKLVSPNGKPAGKARKLSYEAAEIIAAQKVNPKAEEKKTMNEKEGS